MNSLILICVIAFLASGLTLFSGFGLGTILLPVFGIFFPLEVAVAMTAIVHFLNNIFKLSFFAKYAKWDIVLRFGITSFMFAFLGAYCLEWLGSSNPIGSFKLAALSLNFYPIKIVIGVLIIAFALIELLPQLSKLNFDKKYLPFGGALSGFFGGLSGHQGALRSMFLLRIGLSKEQLLGTGVIIACMVDVSRLAVYSNHINLLKNSSDLTLSIAAALSAFAGVFVGNKLLKKITINLLQNIIAIMLIAYSVLLIGGVI